MYKTVRHGENSLQYTILPQTEEVLCNSGLRGKGRDYSPSVHVRRSRRKYKWVLKVVMIISMMLAFSLFCFAMYSLNPAYLKRLLVGDDRDALAIATRPTPVVRDGVKSRNTKFRISPEILSTLGSKMEANPTGTGASYATLAANALPVPSTAAKSTTPPWILPVFKSWKGSSTIQTVPTEGNDILAIGNVNTNFKAKSDVDNMSIKPWEKDIIIRPTIAPESITLRSVVEYYSRSLVPSERPGEAITKIFDDVLITTKGTTMKAPMERTTERSKLKDLKDAMLSVDDDDEFKESLEVDEVFSLPPLKPDPGIVSGDSDEVTVSKAAGGWYGARWPFVDTSSYFQWTGYSPGDNLLLPLLVAALSSVALVLLLALAVRRRKRTHTHTAHIGKLTSELAADDNTNLLTAENLDDAEE